MAKSPPPRLLTPSDHELAQLGAFAAAHDITPAVKTASFLDSWDELRQAMGVTAPYHLNRAVRAIRALPVRS